MHVSFDFYKQQLEPLDVTHLNHSFSLLTYIYHQNME